MKCCLISLLFLPFYLSAQLQTAKIFSDNMVLQRGMPITIWGKAAPGKKVTVKLANEIRSTIAKKDSAWQLSFTKQKGSTKSQSLLIWSEQEKIELHNILIGDVWICSGQSNMEWPMEKEKHWSDEKRKADQQLIRFNNPIPAGRGVFGIAYNDSLKKRLNREDFYNWTSWQSSNSNTIKNMSAVAYYFAKAIVEKEAVPVGLINLSIGGAPIETFTSKEAMQNSKRFSVKLQGNWLENDHLPEWIKERARQNIDNLPAGYGDDHGPNHAYKPGFAFEAGISPLLSFPIKGFIWYQGESNAQEMERVEEYAALSKLMVEDYRRQWKQPQLPFYYVQLSSIDTINYKGQLWPQFRDEQRKIMDLVPFSGMAVTTDIGAQHDVHPINKKEVGQRLARSALYQTYKRTIIPSGPLPVKAIYKNGKLVIQFRYAKGLHTSDGKDLRGFSVDGKTEAKAMMKGNSVVIVAEQKPSFVFYAWKPYTDANLVNEEGLPATTFKLIVQ